MRATISQLYPRLWLYSKKNYCGCRYVWRGNRALRNLDRLYSHLGSLRFYAPSKEATLVLFSRANFQGHFRIYRGTTNIPDLKSLFGGRGPGSLIISSYCLKAEQVRMIRRTGCLPPGFLVV
ncbi:hypothetical protein SAMN05216312_104517 [Cohnella sp. OV330]|uniref:hypothetical protein n=1 Tax=Cohnella sp. OV330 TaxID=1855288 RepID=UPI0008E3665E|nr:hypothetical protein [Cohnella sp. OV330]SFB21823.1 hypothetical protein SAMN05216312_104517 [Cohnella sp. OV330]